MSTRALLLAAICALAAPPLSQAGVVNGDFETGDLTGWTPIGSSHADSGLVLPPTQGLYQGYLESTGNFTALAPAVAASLGIDGSDIAGLAQGVPVNGSGLSQDVTVSAGDTLYFDWNFLTDELDEEATFNDFAFYVIDGSAFLLASRNTSTFDTVLPPVGFDGQTDWANQSYTFTSAGTFKIGFGVFNVGDAGHNSVLLVDSVMIPTPEPSSLVLLAVGMAGVAMRWRRRGADRSVPD